MSGEINVLARTQIIVVEPISKSVSIINAGPSGPPGSMPLGAVTALTNVRNAASGTVTLDLSLYQSFRINMTGNTTLVFTNPPATPLFSAWRIKVTGAFSITFPSTVRWPGGAQPVYAAPSSYMVMTDEGSVPIYEAQQVGSAFS